MGVGGVGWGGVGVGWGGVGWGGVGWGGVGRGGWGWGGGGWGGVGWGGGGVGWGGVGWGGVGWGGAGWGGVGWGMASFPVLAGSVGLRTAPDRGSSVELAVHQAVRQVPEPQETEVDLEAGASIGRFSTRRARLESRSKNSAQRAFIRIN